MACLYYLGRGLDAWSAAVVSGIAIFFAFCLGVVTIEEGIRHGPIAHTGDIDTGKLNLLRASQRATLEELDDITVLLKEIRDALTAAEKT